MYANVKGIRKKIQESSRYQLDPNNLSKKGFTVYKYKLLSYNLNFIQFINKSNLFKDVERKRKLRIFFKTGNKTWEPKQIHHTLSAFLESFKNLFTR